MSMGEPVYPRVDVAEPEVEREPADRRHLLPLDSEIVSPRAEVSRVESAAGSIGNAVGLAVVTVRELPERLRMKQRLQEMKQRFTLIRGRAQGEAAEKADELRAKAVDKYAEARTRAARLARQYPFGVIAAAAGLGLLVGIALRVWRDRD